METDHSSETVNFTSENSSISSGENAKQCSEADNHMFTDLQDFVKATLEAEEDEQGEGWSSDTTIKVEDSTAETSYDYKTPDAEVSGKHIERNNVVSSKKRQHTTAKKKTGKQDLQVKFGKKIFSQKCGKHVEEKGLKKTGIKKTHQNTETKKGTFYCDDCKWTFKIFKHFQKHKKDGKCVFDCEYCGKRYTFRYYANYLVHLKYHKKERVHKCELCNKTYIEAHNLKEHMRKHTGERPFVCDFCGDTFHTSSSLINHKYHRHNKTKPIHKCDICDQVLCSVGNLNAHKKVVHSDERPYTCEQCGKSFKTRRMLEEKHIKVHQQVFPFKCDFPGCEKQFKRVESFNQHCKRHRNERSHFCDQCGKGFYSSKDLKLHIRVHTGEKPYSCEICDYKCAQLGNLGKHMRTHKTSS